MDLEILDGVAMVRMRFGKANAMTAEVLASLEATFARLPESGARAAVVIGDGKSFSAGLALPLLLSLDRDGMRRFIDGFGEAMLRVFTCPLPIVAAIDGHAIAGGCVLALQCDWRVMKDGDAKIGLNEVQLGIGLPSAVIEPLKLAVPPASLVPIALEGQLLGARRALELGLVHEVVDDVEARAIARARELGAVPGVAFGQVKAGLRQGALEAWRARAADETERWLDTWFSGDGRARLAAAVERIKQR